MKKNILCIFGHHVDLLKLKCLSIPVAFSGWPNGEQCPFYDLLFRRKINGPVFCVSFSVLTILVLMHAGLCAVIGQCPCDLTGNACDVNCCCDEDCTADDKLAFSQCLPFSTE